MKVVIFCRRITICLFFCKFMLTEVNLPCSFRFDTTVLIDFAKANFSCFFSCKRMCKFWFLLSYMWWWRTEMSKYLWKWRLRRLWFNRMSKWPRMEYSYMSKSSLPKWVILKFSSQLYLKLIWNVNKLNLFQTDKTMKFVLDLKINILIWLFSYNFSSYLFLYLKMIRILRNRTIIQRVMQARFQATDVIRKICFAPTIMLKLQIVAVHHKHAKVLTIDL